MAPYTAADWQAEIAALYERAEPPPACPNCGRTGFYGPRQNAERTHRYRFCRFCGFAQDVGREPVLYRATVHGCKQWRRIAGAPYIWWLSPAEESYSCPYCGTTVNVKQALVPPPQHDPSHPWWGVPQGLSHAASLAYWETQGYFRLHL